MKQYDTEVENERLVSLQQPGINLKPANLNAPVMASMLKGMLAWTDYCREPTVESSKDNRWPSMRGDCFPRLTQIRRPNESPAPQTAIVSAHAPACNLLRYHIVVVKNSLLFWKPLAARVNH